MGTVNDPLPVKLFLAVMYVDDRLKEKAILSFSEKFGDIDFSYGPLSFDAYTSYYKKEMGENIKKVFLTFKKLVNRCILPEIKIFTNSIESHYSENSRRKVNFDPGYICPDNFVLVSTKDFYQRIYLYKGIYAEITMYYSKEKYNFFPWTYPDYKNENVLKMIEKAREKLVRDLREIRRIEGPLFAGRNGHS